MREIIEMFLNNQGRSYEQLGVEAKVVLCDILFDAAMGRVSIMTDMDTDELWQFKCFITRHGDDYDILTPKERWDYEELYQSEVERI